MIKIMENLEFKSSNGLAAHLEAPYQLETSGVLLFSPRDQIFNLNFE